MIIMCMWGRCLMLAEHTYVHPTLGTLDLCPEHNDLAKHLISAPLPPPDPIDELVKEWREILS